MVTGDSKKAKNTVPNEIQWKGELRLKTWKKACCLSGIILAAFFFAACGGKGSSEFSTYSEEKESSKLPAYSEIIHGKDNNTDTALTEESLSVEHFDFYSEEKPSPEQLEYAAQRYYFWPSGESSIEMNGLGEILGTKDIQVSGIRDVLTGETRFYEAAYKTYNKREDWGYDVSYTSRVYDLSGNIVIDWAEATYLSCVGDWLMAQRYIDFNMADGDWDYRGRLLNVRTKEEIPDIAALEKINSTAAFVQAKDMKQSFTVDADGNILYDFSLVKTDIDGDYYLSCYQEYVVAEKNENSFYQLTFYSPDGKLLGTIDGVEDSYIYNSDILQPYVMCDRCIYDPSEGDGGDLEPVFQIDEPRYYDGERAVCAAYRNNGSSYCTLYDAKTGEALTKEYEVIYTTTIDNGDTAGTPSAFFIGMNKNKIEKLDRSGKVIAEAAMENICGVNIYSTAIVVDRNEYTTECLLDLQLNVLIPENKYMAMYPVYDEQESTKSGLWVGQYYFGKEQMYTRSDLLTIDGEIVMSGLSSIGNMSNGKIPVIRGQTLGLIDAKGNWLLKMPKYELSNED